MALGEVGTMIAIMMLVLVVCHFNPRTAHRVLEHSQQLFEADEPLPVAEQADRIPQRVDVTWATRTTRQRPYITPLVKKRVAANQKWRCASCKRLWDETYEIDHIKPLFKGGANSESNIQALCKRCHTMKSAAEQSSG